MRTKNKIVRVDRFALGFVLFAAPLVLGAKGCDTAVVGDDRHPEAGAGTGTSGGDGGTGGSRATGGTSGTATGGSPAAGGTSGRTAAGGSPASGGASGKGGSYATGGSPAAGGAAGTSGPAGAAGDAGSGDGTMCGGLQGVTCGADEYCDFASDAMCGATDQPGSCEPKPQVCPQIDAPACGCDGKTYSSDCAAHAAGVSVASEGACTTPPGPTCGGDTGVTCDAGSFCEYPATAQCGRRGDTGTCTLIPEGCDTLYQPVCGCDGNTYPNACYALREQVSVASTGACDGGDTCGGLSGATCPSEQFCNFPIEAQCGSGDQTGTCTLSGGVACSNVVMEVCGCDGKTYPNACYALRAQVSVASNGACPAP